MQTLTYSPVPRHLQPYLGMVYSGIAEPGITPLPSMMAQIWVCTFPVYWTGPGMAQPQRLPPVTLMGPIMGANTVYVAQPGRIMGLGLWPRFWTEVLRLPAADLTDQAIDASALWPALTSTLLDRIHAASGWNAQANILTNFVDDLLRAARPTPDAHLVSIIDRWLAQGAPIDDLTDRLGYSHRQVLRITARTHGGTPKLLLARQRALRTAATLVKHPHGSQRLWAEYADQSHFIRDFRRFIGGTPTAFGRESRIGHSMFSESWKSDDDHPLAYGADSATALHDRPAAHGHRP